MKKKTLGDYIFEMEQSIKVIQEFDSKLKTFEIILGMTDKIEQKKKLISKFLKEYVGFTDKEVKEIIK